MILTCMDQLNIIFKKKIMSIRLMNVRHEDVVFILFLYTFENKTLTWYFNLPIRTIHNWNDFQTKFLDQFGEDKTLRSLME